jgi:hypothetical protein
MAKKSSTNVVNLATARKKTGKAAPAKPKEEVVVEEPVVEVEPTVDELAEKRVKELLKDVDLSPNKKEEDLLELDEDDGQPKSLEWLEEQVGALGSENERLRLEASEAKENYNKLYAKYEQVKGGGTPTGGIADDPLVPDSLIKRGAISLFDEFQTEFLRHPRETRAYTQITLVALMKKMFDVFPFLEEHRRF